MSEACNSTPPHIQAQPQVRAGRRRLSLKTASFLAMIPTAGLVAVVFYVFVGWTVVISFTSSRLLPSYTFVGWQQYRRLFASNRWWTTMENLAIYASTLICGCMALGLMLAVLIDRGTRFERLYRTSLMLPLSMSFVVTGIVWQWLLNPGLGIEHAVRVLGWDEFRFDWLVRSDRSIYTIALAGIWQQSGMCMAIFLAGLRSVDGNFWKAARVDAIPTWRVYLQIIFPQMRTAFFTAFVLMFAAAAKSYDLVVTLTGGGPGFASDLPARFVVEHLARNELGMGAAGACMLLITIAAAVGPYLYMEMRRQKIVGL